MAILVHSSGFQPLRSWMTTKVMKGFVKVICVILCLIISSTAYTGSILTTAYAESILWAAKHSSTNLIKDEEWLAATLLTEEQDAAPPAEDVEASPLETIDNPEPGEEAEGMESIVIPDEMDSAIPDEPELPEEGVKEDLVAEPVT